MLHTRTGFLLLLLILFGCGKDQPAPASNPQRSAPAATQMDRLPARCALLSTQYPTLEALQTVVDIEYYSAENPGDTDFELPAVRVVHQSAGRQVISVLESGVSQGDFQDAQQGSFWTKVQLGLKSPYAALHKEELTQIFSLARRLKIFGIRDVAFYDLAQAATHKINRADLVNGSPNDTLEKGYINTFNHVTAQALITTLFSEELAEFISAVHERHNMPELLTGSFTQEQLTSADNNPVDNYVDLVNNEWGQELGKQFREKYQIDRNTTWTPELLCNYLNDLQAHYSWAFRVGMKPFRPEERIVVAFAAKINLVLTENPGH